MGNIETYDTGSVMDVALGTTGMPVLYSTILYCTVLYYTVHWTVLYNTV